MIKRLLNSAVAISGYEIRRRVLSAVHDLRDERYSPTPIEAGYLGETQRYIVNVPTWMVGKTRLINLWVDTLQAYVACGEGAARHRLQLFFRSFKPESVADFLQISPSRPWHHGHPLSYVYPWDADEPENKMAFRLELMRREARDHGFPEWSESDGWKGFGPASDEIVDLELGRLLRIYDSISKHGFDERYGLVLGRSYGWGAREMVLPRRGWHRVAVCLALDMHCIPMSFDRCHSIIRYEDADRWPNVMNGYFTVSEAQDIFTRRFESTVLPLRHAAEGCPLEKE